MGIYKKLANVQKKIIGIVKGAENPYFKSKYFDINQMLETLKPTLQEENLLLLQPLSNVNGIPAIKTMLVDTETDEMIESTVTLPNLNDPQKMGSSITYYRRYSLQSLFSLQALDDDGNMASGKTETLAGKGKKKKLEDEIQSGYKAMGMDETEIYTMEKNFLDNKRTVSDLELLLKSLRNKYKTKELGK